MQVDLEMTHASADDDEIVIADDLAEDAIEEVEEHTETGATVPPVPPPFTDNTDA